MSTTNQTNSDSKSGAMSPEQYEKMLAAIEASEKNNIALEKQEQDLHKQIEDVEADENKQEQWLKDHDHLYDKVASWFTGARDAHESQENADKAQLSILQGELSDIQDKINNALNEQFAVPIAMLNLQVEKLFKEISGSGGNISQKLLEDVMAVMSEVMALVQMILAQADNDKGQQESRISKITVMNYDLSNKNTQTQLHEYISMMHTASIMKAISMVVKVVICVAAIAIAAATGGACSVLVAVIIAALVMSGATDKLTEVIAKKLQQDGLSSGLAKILSDVIVTAVMIVGTLGVGAVSAIAEGIATEVISSVMENVVSEVSEDIINSAVEDAVSTIGEEAGESATASASTAARTVATDVATAAGKEALRGAVRDVLRQALAGTIRQTVTSAGREALSQAVKSAVEEAVQSAVSGAAADIGDAANIAASGVEEGVEQSVIDEVTQLISQRAVASATQDSASAVARSLANVSSVNVGRSVVNGLGTGIMGTNLLADSVGGILQLIYGKDAKKKEWYQIVMDIVKVIQDILALVMMAKFGGSMVDGLSEDASATFAQKMDKLQYAATGTLGLAGLTQGTLSMVQGGISEKEADITESLAHNKQAILILNQLVQEMNQLMKDEQKHQSTELKDETNNTLKTINQLNQGAQGYANVLAASAV